MCKDHGTDALPASCTCQLGAIDCCHGGMQSRAACLSSPMRFTGAGSSWPGRRSCPKCATSWSASSSCALLLRCVAPSSHCMQHRVSPLPGWIRGGKGCCPLVCKPALQKIQGSFSTLWEHLAVMGTHAVSAQGSEVFIGHSRDTGLANQSWASLSWVLT